MLCSIVNHRLNSLLKIFLGKSTTQMYITIITNAINTLGKSATQMYITILTQNNYIQKGISRRIVSHASLRMFNFLASVMREFYEEIDRKNRIFGRKTDILRKCVARCAILLNIYGKKDCFDVSSYNWAHKHHFIVRKTKKTYLSDCENSHEKQQTGIFCELKTCFYLSMSG